MNVLTASRFVCLAILLITSSGVAQETAGSTHTEAGTVVVDGHPYPYAVQLPVPAGTTIPAGLPVILALHGAGSRGTYGVRMRSQSIAEAARRHGERYLAIVVMPQAPGRWNPRARESARRAAGNTRVRLTEYAGEGHDIFDRVYGEPELPVWLLEQQRPGGR